MNSVALGLRKDSLVRNSLINLLCVRFETADKVLMRCHLNQERKSKGENHIRGSHPSPISTTGKEKRDKVYQTLYPGLTVTSCSLSVRSSASTVSQDIYLGLPIVTKVHPLCCITH